MSLLKNFLNSFHYAFRGIWSILLSERNMRVHLFAAIVAMAFGVYFNITTTEWCIVVLCIGMVMASEVFNSALEALTDLVKPEQHPVAGKVKDTGAGAVLLSALAAAVTGILVFWKYFFPAS